MADAVDVETVIVRRQRSAGQGIAGDFLVVDLGSGRYFGLGEVGGFIWERLEVGKTLGEIGEDVAAHYSVSAAEARADTLEFAQQLLDQGLAERAGDGIQPPPADRS